MNRHAIYLAGIFESEGDSLSQFISAELQNLGIRLELVELYPNKKFGSYSFRKEIQRIQNIIQEKQPEIVIAHSLGCYVAIHFPIHYSLILLDPSMNVSEIVKSLGNGFAFSPTFLKSVRACASIENLATNIQSGERIFIVGAEKGGHKIAEQYHQNLSGSQYVFLSGANHDFSDETSRQEIFQIIKGRLGMHNA